MFEKNDVGEANEFYKIKFAFGVDKPVRLRIVPDCQGGSISLFSKQ